MSSCDQAVMCSPDVQVADTVRELNGVAVMEFDTGEWSVDIGFRGHKVAIEVRPCDARPSSIATVLLYIACPVQMCKAGRYRTRLSCGTFAAPDSPLPCACMSWPSSLPGSKFAITAPVVRLATWRRKLSSAQKRLSPKKHATCQ